MKRLAVIDLGSNSVRMSIYEIDENGGYTETKSFRNMIKLSEGMTADMRLQPAAQLRAVRAMLEFKSILAAEGVHDVTAVATAAVRKALNGDEFLKSVFDATGIGVKVIDGKAEARYDYLAVKNTVGCQNGIICDIGGGSTEIIGAADGKVIFAESIPVGSRGITERFFANGENDVSIGQAKEFFGSEIDRLSLPECLKGVPQVGIGGCLRAVGKYDRHDATKEKLAKHTIGRDRLEKIFDEIIHSSVEERKKMPGIGEERADIILGGIIPLICFTERLNPPSLTVADVGVRDGILFDFMNNGR